MTTIDNLEELHTDILLSGTYYDDCDIEVRTYDIYLYDNTLA